MRHALKLLRRLLIATGALAVIPTAAQGQGVPAPAKLRTIDEPGAVHAASEPWKVPSAWIIAAGSIGIVLTGAMAAYLATGSRRDPKRAHRVLSRALGLGRDAPATVEKLAPLSPGTLPSTLLLCDGLLIRAARDAAARGLDAGGRAGVRRLLSSRGLAIPPGLESNLAATPEAKPGSPRRPIELRRLVAWIRDPLKARSPVPTPAPRAAGVRVARTDHTSAPGRRSTSPKKSLDASS